MNGVINVFKPAGITSHGVVSRVRRAFGIKRVGHTGTLDPIATGVLPVCVGKATRAAELICASDKEYRCTISFGSETDTQDRTGKVTGVSDKRISENEFMYATEAFIGDILQVPPMYSAVHHEGKRLYELAREGTVVERELREVKIFSITLETFSSESAVFTVSCSKGTYIRTLCEDLGRHLGCLAHMSELMRTKSGVFTLETCIELDEVSAEKLIPVDKLFLDYEMITISLDDAAKVKNGVRIKNPGETGKHYRVYDSEGVFLCLSVGILDRNEKVLKVEKGFC